MKSARLSHPQEIHLPGLWTECRTRPLQARPELPAGRSRVVQIYSMLLCGQTKGPGCGPGKPAAPSPRILGNCPSPGCTCPTQHRVALVSPGPPASSMGWAAPAVSEGSVGGQGMYPSKLCTVGQA